MSTHLKIHEIALPRLALTHQGEGHAQFEHEDLKPKSQNLDEFEPGISQALLKLELNSKPQGPTKGAKYKSSQGN